ncbi:hypothetical protein VB690_24440, partial [Nodularia spumigena CH309]|nr:hypothetical protein [Nodularia spumigena CH309]
MSHHLPDTRIPAPCIVNTGIIVNKLDIRRLLSDLGRVRYIYTQEGKIQSEGEADVMEVFLILPSPKGTGILEESTNG